MEDRLKAINQYVDFLAADTQDYFAQTELKYLDLELERIKSEMWQWFVAQKFDPNQPRAPRGTPIGGQWILDLTQIAKEYGWRDAEILNDHFKNHGKQFKASSPRDYAQRAKTFYEKGVKQKLPMVQDKFGNVRIYDPKTNIFGSYNPDGTPKTLFKPRAREKYFNTQIKKYIAKGGKIINPLPEKPVSNINRSRGTNRGGGGGSRGGGGSLRVIPSGSRGVRILPFVNL